MKLTSRFSFRSLSAAGFLLAACSTAFANGTIFLEVGNPNAPGGGFGEKNPYQYGDGGEFTALTTGLPSKVPAGYSAAATFTVNGVTGFETFCIEDKVDFYVGTTYDYSLGTAIQQTKGQLSAGAAWLYEQFAKGTLAGYDYNLGNDAKDAAARLKDAGLLQATLWALQGEAPDSNVPYDNSPITNPFLADIDSKFGNLTNAEVAAGTSFGVQVMELTDKSGNVFQDQLIYTGGDDAPDAGMTALLLGISLLSLAALRRRLKAA